MASFFIITKNKIKPAPETLLIDVYRQIWLRDATADKTQALDDFAYIYFMADYKSIYISSDITSRSKQVAKEILGKEEYKPDKLIKDGINKYMQIQATPTMRLLTESQRTLENITNYLSKERLKIDSDNIDTIIKTIEKCSKLVSSLNELDKKVKEELNDGVKVYGSQEVSFFEDPANL